MTDNELLDDLRIAMTAARGKTGRHLRATLAELIRTTTARTCLDEAIDRAGRCGDDELFFRLVETRLALDSDQADWRALLDAALADISWLNADGNNA